MYYSIPGARDHKLVGQEIDLSDLNLPEGPVSRSFTNGAVKSKEGSERRRQPRRHSDTVKSEPAPVEPATKPQGSWALDLDSSLIIDEEKEFKPSKAKHCRSRSKVEDLMNELELELAMEAACRQEPPERQHALVKRKSVISFETIDDSLLDEAMAEVSALQPKVDRRPSYNHILEDGIRRGSKLQDILFESIKNLTGEDFDFSDDEDWLRVVYQFWGNDLIPVGLNVTLYTELNVNKCFTSSNDFISQLDS